MAKISELLSIQGNKTKSNDLFVTVNVESGELGTKNITRSELVKSIQQENFDAISITGGNADNIEIQNSLFIGNEFISPAISNPSLDIDSVYSSLEEDDYFVLRDVSTNQTVKITFASLQNEIANTFAKVTKLYVDSSASVAGNGSYYRPYQTLEEAFSVMQSATDPVSISVLPGVHYTNGNLSLPDNCSIVSTNGQYATKIVMNDGFEEENCFLVGSSCYVQGFSFDNMRVDSFENPTKGFAVAFRPGALILRSPYIRDISQISNYKREAIAAPLDPQNANPLVGRGGGVLLADRALLNQNSIFPYMLAFAATPRSPNGMGYVAKNGAGINGISSITIFQRNAFYALNGGQITLNNSGTQFGDISMRAKGSTQVVEPHETALTNIIKSEPLANFIEQNTQTIINQLWASLLTDGFVVDEAFTRRDSEYFLRSVKFDFLSGKQTGSRNFVAGFYDYKGELTFDPNGFAGSGKTLIESFTYSFEFMKNYIITNYSPALDELNMLEVLVDDIIIDTLISPTLLNFGSLIESIGHQFNLAGAGVNKNALPLNFRRVGKPAPASSSVLQEDGGRVRWSGADELNNQYFARGLRVNGRTGRLEGRPFTSSVRRLARRAANSRVSI
jgi:hypothetical protein